MPQLSSVPCSGVGLIKGVTSDLLFTFSESYSYLVAYYIFLDMSIMYRIGIRR